MKQQTYVGRNDVSQKKGLSVKDLVITGIFSALLFALIMLGGGFFAVNPLLTFYMPLGSALLAGPVFLLLIAKVPKRGPILIAGILLGIIYFATGMHWALATGYIVMGIVAEIVAGIKNYRNIKLNILSYMIFCLGGVFTYMVFFIDPVGWAKTMLQNGTDQAYISTMQSSAPAWMPVVIIVGTLAVAALSGFLGSKLLKKQFEKAGITE